MRCHVLICHYAETRSSIAINSRSCSSAAITATRSSPVMSLIGITITGVGRQFAFQAFDLGFDGIQRDRLDSGAHRGVQRINFHFSPLIWVAGRSPGVWGRHWGSAAVAPDYPTMTHEQVFAVQNRPLFPRDRVEFEQDERAKLISTLADCVVERGRDGSTGIPFYRRTRAPLQLHGSCSRELGGGMLRRRVGRHANQGMSLAA